MISSEVFINLAAVHRDDIKPLSLYDDVNVEGSRKICELARKRNVKKLFLLVQLLFMVLQSLTPMNLVRLTTLMIMAEQNTKLKNLSRMV